MHTIWAISSAVSELIAENTAAGKINSDDQVDTADAVLLMQYLLGTNTEAVRLENCDANGDGEISPADVVRILRRISKN